MQRRFFLPIGFFAAVSLSMSLAVLARPMSEPTSRPTTRAATAPASDTVDHDSKLSVTHGSVVVDGKTIDYRATAGTLALKDESGKSKADVFFVAYDTEAAEAGDRPITFCFNGGPGAAAVWLHLGAAGPRTVALDDHDVPVGPPFELADNSDTWLAATDLVFVDPVSTGFSRPAAGEKAEQFHGVKPDLDSVADFVRTYMTKYRRWSSPVYLAGESYGTTRAAALAGVLADKYGVAVSGIALISSVLDFQTLVAGPGNDLPYVMYLPSFTAVAGYHHKLPADLQADVPKAIEASREFAAVVYAPALAKGDALPEADRAKVVAELARLTGLPAEDYDRGDLRVSPDFFEKRLLGNGHEIIGRFDGRITGYDPNALSNHPSFDPSLSRYQSAYASAFNDYVRRVLKYDSDLPYEVLTDVGPWSLSAGPSGGYLYVVDDLQSAIVQNPKLRVLFVSGRDDLATPFSAADYAIDRLNLGPELSKNITHVYFPAGHMVYHDKTSKHGLQQAIAGLISGK